MTDETERVEELKGEKKVTTKSDGKKEGKIFEEGNDVTFFNLSQ